MRNITEETVTEATVALIKAEDPRLAEVMESLIRHLHAFIREIELTEEEWMAGIRFLTETGQITDDKRQEFILLSDTLGASILVGRDQSSEVGRIHGQHGVWPVLGFGLPPFGEWGPYRQGPRGGGRRDNCRPRRGQGTRGHAAPWSFSRCLAGLTRGSL